MNPSIYTIGHSTHSSDYFLDLLQEHRITCLVDVRSIAASRYNPQYSKEPLSQFLKSNQILYLHFAEEFGARQIHADVLDEEGKVDFEKVRATTVFKKGVARLWDGVRKGFSITLMCAESNPLDCHRFSMIAPALKENGFEVKHILKDKKTIVHEQLETELLKIYERHLPKPDIFKTLTRDAQLKAAYRLHNKKVGFNGSR